MSGLLDLGIRAADAWRDLRHVVAARAIDNARRDLRRKAGLQRRTVALPDGRTVAYLDAETDLPPALWIHGIGASKDHWTRLAAPLGADVRPVIPDLPGFGESDLAGDLSMVGQADAAVAVMDTLGLDRVHLAGSSMGGRVAAELAARHPDRLLSLWLLAPAGAEGEAPSEMITGLFEGAGVPLFARTADEYAASLAFTMGTPPELPRAVLEVLAAESDAAYAHNLDVFADISWAFARGPSTEELLAGLAVPTLVTWGDADRVLHPSGAETIAAAVPGAHAHVLPGIGHLPMIEAPDVTAAEFRAFLRSL